MADPNLYGKPPLHIAAENNDTAAIDLLVRQGADVNAKDAMGNTPMHIAAKNGSIFAIHALHEHKADINSLTIYGETPLILATKESGAEAVVKTLVKLKADIDHIDPFGASAISEAAKHKDGKTLKYLIRRGANLNPHRSEASQPCQTLLDDPVRAAIKANLPQNALYLVMHGAKADTSRDPKFLDILRKKIADENDSARQQIIDNLVERLQSFHEASNNILEAACVIDDVELLKQHIKRFNIDIKTYANDRNGGTLLHMAIMHGAEKAATYLIDNGADLYAVNFMGGGNALQFAATCNKANIIELLVAKGADLERTISKSQPPALIAAIYANHYEAAETLIKLGAKVDYTSHPDDTTFVIATKFAAPEMIHLLARSGLPVLPGNPMHSEYISTAINWSNPANAQAFIELGASIREDHLSSAKESYEKYLEDPKDETCTEEEWEALIRQLEILANKGKTNLRTSTPATSVINTTANLVNAPMLTNGVQHG